jgi:hypothetical protein
MLVLRMDHGRQRQDVPSLAGAGSETVQLCQTIPRPPTTIGDLAPTIVVMAFTNFVVHVLSQHERGDPVPEDEMGYIKRLYHVSHPIMNPHAPIDDYTIHVPPYEEVIVYQQWARQPPDPFQIIQNIRLIVDSVMGVPDVFSNPIVDDIMEGIWS